MRQAITWTNDDPVNWRLYAALGEDELRNKLMRYIVCKFHSTLYTTCMMGLLVWLKHKLQSGERWGSDIYIDQWHATERVALELSVSFMDEVSPSNGCFQLVVHCILPEWGCLFLNESI